MVEPSKELQLVFDKVVKDAVKLRHEYVTLEHLLYAMLCENNFSELVTGFGTDVEYIKKNLENYLRTKLDNILVEKGKEYKPAKTQTVERVLNRAFTQVLFSMRNMIEISDVFLSILSEKKSYAYFITQQAGVNKQQFADYISTEFDRSDDDNPQENMGIANKALKEFTSDLNSLVKNNKIVTLSLAIDSITIIKFVLKPVEPTAPTMIPAVAIAMPTATIFNAPFSKPMIV